MCESANPGLHVCVCVCECACVARCVVCVEIDAHCLAVSVRGKSAGKLAQSREGDADIPPLDHLACGSYGYVRKGVLGYADEWKHEI